jgi:hypothetical protein
MLLLKISTIVKMTNFDPAQSDKPLHTHWRPLLTSRSWQETRESDGPPPCHPEATRELSGSQDRYNAVIELLNLYKDDKIVYPEFCHSEQREELCFFAQGDTKPFASLGIRIVNRSHEIALGSLLSQG